MLIWDRWASQDTFSAIHVLGDTSMTATSIYALRECIIRKASRYKVLFDDVFRVVDVANEPPNNVVHFNIFKEINMATRFDGATSLGSDYIEGKCLVLAFSDVADASAGPTMEYKARCSYTDV